MEKTNKLATMPMPKLVMNLALPLMISLVSTAAFVLLGLTCTGKFVHAFTQDETIAVYSRQYLSVCMIFCVGHRSL
jgi:hypothetical protein